VLEKTLGVPLFQEQAMRVAIECAGFTPSEADQLRRAMATFKFTAGVSRFREKLITGMVARGYDAAFAERTFKQLEGFGSYGFPESHAASFAKIAYASSWMKCHHPDVFCCAILNSQPMGFYAPAQLVRDAQVHGIEVRPVDINHSRWDCTLEQTRNPRRFAVRLGLKMVHGLANTDGGLIPIMRAEQPFASIEDLWRRAGISVKALKHLAEADAFGSLGVNRRDAIWTIEGLSDEVMPLFAAADERDRMIRPELIEPEVEFVPMTEGREVVEDYRSKGLTLRRHPVSFLRQELIERRIRFCGDLHRARDGQRVTVAGLVLVRQKPGSAKGVTFMTIEDETDVANLVIWSTVFEKHRRLILSSGMIGCRGRLQREGGVTHLIAEYFLDLSDLLRSVGDRDKPLLLRHGRGDEAKAGTHETLRIASRVTPEEAAPNLSENYETPVIRVATRDFR
jgi:error-prone DNA polymerase